VTAIVFTGPTLPAADAARLLPGAITLPPARQGDIFRAVRDRRPRAIGLIDGVFLHEPAVWHREILWALSEGVHVFGAASMGALRAAELCSFGMRGVGKVFEAYRDGIWPGFDDVFEDDDEVAVVHAPAELGALPLSDAMVDLRDTLLAAESAGLVSRAERDSLCAALKAMPFPQRSFSALPEPVRANRVARKRLDAEAMLTEIEAFLATGPAPFTPGFRFEHVHVWDHFVRSQIPDDDAVVLDELRLRPSEWNATARAVLGRPTAASASGANIQDAFKAFRIERGLARRADLDAWLADNAMTEAALARLLHQQAALTAALPSVPPAAIADHLRLTGAYAPLLRRARAKQAALAGIPPLPAGPAADGALIWFAERNNIAIDAIRNDTALAAAVCREYQFQRRIS
jgi:hypothetical protein